MRLSKNVSNIVALSTLRIFAMSVPGLLLLRLRVLFLGGRSHFGISGSGAANTPHSATESDDFYPRVPRSHRI